LLSSNVFAQAAGTSSSSTVTHTITTGGTINHNDNASSQSTTYTTTTSTTVTSHDDDIVSAIYKKYAKDSALIGTTLTVSSQNGVVSIGGTVTSQSQSDEATIAAKSVPGVKAVRSSVNVITSNPKIQPQIPNY
jgi:osmotically-inducible protein OsmY